MLRLGHLPHLAPHAPPRWHERPVHYDPDLTSVQPTYGDNCRRAGRAYSLRRAQSGDRIVFLARLWHHGPAFYLVGELQVADVLADAASDPGPGWWDGNAHVRRARAWGLWDSFWVFRGGPGSRLYERAKPFDRSAAERFFATERWEWPAHRSELQVIGSHTRAVRRLP